MVKGIFLKEYLVKIIKELFGCSLISVGTLFMLYSDLGLNPWGILHQGISIQTHLTFGQASQLLGFAILIICLFFNVIPGIGTVLSMYFIGKFIDIIDRFSIIYTPNSIVLKLFMLLAGSVFMAFGMFSYLRENLGAGPKDGLMILLNKKTNVDIGVVRMIMELSAVFLGYILGGRLGIGTIITAMILGPTLRFIFKIFNYNAKENVHENFIDTYNKIFNN